MNRFIGIDVHGQSCTVCVMDSRGRRIRSAVVETNGKALVETIRQTSGNRFLCMEEGTHSDWLCEVLQPHAKELVVIQPLRNRDTKNDERDAWGLADMYRRDALPHRIFKAPRLFTGLRQAARGYLATQQDVVRVKGRLHALYRSRGIVPTRDIYDVDARLECLEKLPPRYRELGELLSHELDGLVTSHELAKDWFLDQAATVPVTKRLATAPGIGPIRSALIVTIVMTPTRFRTKRQFWSYCGLGIITRSSSDWQKDKDGDKWVKKNTTHTVGLNRNRHPILKSIFKGAATNVIDQMKRHPLHADYERLVAAGTKPNLAKLTIARRIAAAVLAIWKHEEDYDPAKHQSTARS